MEWNALENDERGKRKRKGKKERKKGRERKQRAAALRDGVLFAGRRPPRPKAMHARPWAVVPLI